MGVKGNKLIFFTSILLIIILILFSSNIVFASEEKQETQENIVCAVYFTGDNCPHCVKAKPVIDKILSDTPNLVLIMYEVQSELQNTPVLEKYSSEYGIKPAFPLIIFGEENYLQGDSPIISQLKNKASALKSNPCPLIDKSSIDYNLLNSSTLPGKPRILSKGNNSHVNTSSEGIKTELTIIKIISLASTDAINPCVYAVLVWILIAILTSNPDKKRKVLLSGLAFAAAVFIIYFLYGVAIVAFFQAVQSFAKMKIIFYKIMALLAILIGILNIRDFLSYKPGRAGTEMPLMFRPKVKKIISAVTSPKGAFGLGAFVTIFLLPCTIGPYIIAGGILSSLKITSVLSWLLFYNFIFVLPIIIITLIIYGGLSSVENVSEWKDKNIKYIHLAEGIITLLLGIAMLTGLI
jgi:cytochrome c biogenesis protein CcdA